MDLAFATFRQCLFSIVDYLRDRIAQALHDIINSNPTGHPNRHVAVDKPQLVLAQTFMPGLGYGTSWRAYGMSILLVALGCVRKVV